MKIARLIAWMALGGLLAAAAAADSRVPGSGTPVWQLDTGG